MRKIQKPAQVVPTPLEEHLGEVWDPRGYEEKIAIANDLLSSFVEDMNNGKAPEVTLDQVRDAAGTLGYFSGYPDDAAGMDGFLESPLASSSHRAIAQVLPSFIDDMNTLIRARIEKLSEQPSLAVHDAARPISDDDLPF